MTDIGYDQVAWVNDALKRYEQVLILSYKQPEISRLRDVAKIAFILEIAEILGQVFDNKTVLLNCISGIPERDKS